MKSFLLITAISFSLLSFSQTNNGGTQVNGTINGLIDNMSIKLFSFPVGGPKVETDGVRGKFGNNYCPCVDGNDGIKFMGTGIESISLLRDGVRLAIEARPAIITTDTSFIEMLGMNVGGSYQFLTTPTNFDTSVATCKLIDHFLGTETSISLTDTTTYNFNITAAVGSDATDRFSFIYISTVTLPANTLNIKAYQKNKAILIDWETKDENNIKLYEIEKSSNSTSFSKISTVIAKNNSTNNKYSFIDNSPSIGANYYRVKTILTNDNQRYSAIAKVDLDEKNVKGFTVYPNPVKGKTIALRLSNMEAGDYTAKLFNAVGQQIYSAIIAYTSSNNNLVLQLKNSLSAGTYQLQLINSKGNNYQQTLIVIE